MSTYTHILGLQMCVCVCVCVCACVCACVRAHVRACARASLRVLCRSVCVSGCVCSRASVVCASREFSMTKGNHNLLYNVTIYIIIRDCTRVGAFPRAFCVPNSVALASLTLQVVYWAIH